MKIHAISNEAFKKGNCYNVQETALLINKSVQTVRSYIKRGYLKLSAGQNRIDFQITGESIHALPAFLHESLQQLRKNRSTYMKNQWKKINV